MADPDPYELATPTLMRAARGVYAQSIRTELHDIGVEDLPRNGATLLAGIAATGGPRQDLPAGLGVTKQAVSQAIEILASRGYLERNPDPGDRRRISLTLTSRGQEVIEAVVRGVESVDARLLERVPAEQVAAMRSALLALSEIKTDAVASGTGKRRPPPQFRQFSPIFPVRDMTAALAHYTALGFDAFAYAGPDDYGFANRDGIGLHLTGDPGHDPAHSHASAYLYVRDADALYAEWSRPGIGGQTRPASPTPYRLREGAHTDPDGNLIRFGSPMRE
jgi:DNA-binding MarR family transcriptional regulator